MKKYFSILLVLTTALNIAKAQVNASFTQTVSSGCSPLVVTFTDQSTGPVTSWNWNFGNGNTSTQQNPAAAYLNPGTYDVSLVVSDGVNFDTFHMPNAVTVYADPRPNFTVSQTLGCSPLNVQFSDQTLIGDGPISSYIWDFGDGTNSSAASPGHVYLNPGTYGITMIVTDANGCTNDTVVPALISVVAIPTAGFSANPTSACVVPHQVNFTNNSTGTGAMSYLWDFGDGGTSTQANPGHTYNAFGNYTVTLIVTDASGCSDTIVQNNLIQLSTLTADFSASDTVICLGAPVSFNDLSTPPSTSSTWTFGDGNSSNQLNPTHTYNAPGTYTVSLQASAAGCSSQETKNAYITVVNTPTAAFNAPNTTSCNTPFTVNFNNTSTGGNSFLWNFGDGNTSTAQNPTHTYTTGTSFNVSLTVTNNFGCTDQQVSNQFVQIVPTTAAFNADTVTGCIPLNVDFVDLSTTLSSIVSWFWDFGDGNTSTAQNPSHTYTSEGIYDVSLVVVDSAGCSDTLVSNGFIMAGDTVNVDFAALDTTPCIEDAVMFVNLSDSSTNWFWEFGDGQTSMDFEPSYQYSDTGFFTVSLTTVNLGCRSTSEKIDYIYVAPPDARFDFTINCANPFEVTFDNTSLAPDVWNWDFGTGDSSFQFEPTYVFPDTGIYSVTLWVADSVYGCDDSEIRDVYITDPVARFTGTPLWGCNPLTVSFTDSSIHANTYRWFFGDGTSSNQRNPVHTYTVNDTFTVTLVITDIHGCTDTMIRPDYVIVIGPTANFGGTPLSGCLPLSVDFTDSSTTLSDSIVSWYWQFGDGNTSTLQNPTHVYTSRGRFDVSLTVTDNNGCVHTLTRNRYIHATYPIPDFSANNLLLCQGETTTFTSTSLGYQLTYLWDFGDGTGATGSSQVVSYSNPGTYTVTLITVDGNGCTDTMVRPDYITVVEPIAAFGGSPLYASCPPLQVNFMDTSFGANVVSWYWDFGDNTSSTLANPSHVYNAPGAYDVTLIITTAGGCIDTLYKPAYVNVDGPNGIYVLDPPNGCVNHLVNFYGQTVNAATVIWDFGDGSVLPAGDTVAHTYTTPGVFLPLMILDDGLGCTYVVDLNDTVRTGILNTSVASLPTAICPNTVVNFDGIVNSNPAIQSLKWFFGDGDSASIEDPSHLYSVPGVYDITFIAENEYCIDTNFISQGVYVDPGPVAAFTRTDSAGCAPWPFTFIDQSTSDSAIISWVWDLGDGTSSTQRNPNKIYSIPGTYIITLIVTNVNGCSDTVSRSITVHPRPIAAAGPSATICEGDSVQLTGSGGGDYSWTPGNVLADSEIPNPIAFPTATTTFTLTVTNQFGCTDDDTVTVTVIPNPVLSVTNDTSFCAGDGVDLLASGAISYQWSPAVGLSCTNCPNPTSNPFQSTTYTVIGTGTFGCTGEDTTRVTVNPVPQGLAFGDTSLCYGDTADLLAVGGTTFQWTITGDLSCLNCPNPTAYPIDTATYQVTITNSFGCVTNDQVTINVVQYPDFPPLVDRTICEGDTAWVSFANADVYLWSPANEITCISCPDPGLFPSQDRRYYVAASNGFGCTSFDSIDITVAPRPIVDAGEGDLICAGEQFQLNGSGNAILYEWDNIASLSNPFTLNPMASPDVTTLYTLTATNQFNCTNTDTVSIRVIESIVVEPDTTHHICEGGSVQLEPRVVIAPNRPLSYVWSPPYFLNQPQSIDPIANPATTTTYNLITSSGNCTPDTTEITVVVHPNPFVNAGQDQTVVSGTDVEIIASGTSDVDISWSDGSLLSCDDCFYPIHFATESIGFEATVTDEWGCTDSDSVYINVIDQCEGDVLFVPTGFSPNGDGNNDILRIRSIGLTDIQFFRIFDRWGNLLYETDDIENGWDGTYRGTEVNGGVYVWLIRAICSNGEETTRSGNVTLLR